MYMCVCGGGVREGAGRIDGGSVTPSPLPPASLTTSGDSGGGGSASASCYEAVLVQGEGPEASSVAEVCLRKTGPGRRGEGRCGKHGTSTEPRHTPAGGSVVSSRREAAHTRAPATHSRTHCALPGPRPLTLLHAHQHGAPRTLSYPPPPPRPRPQLAATTTLTLHTCLTPHPSPLHIPPH